MNELIHAIITNPFDDLPRLIYADEIEESNPRYAEFIRLQIEQTNYEQNTAFPRKRDWDREERIAGLFKEIRLNSSRYIKTCLKTPTRKGVFSIPTYGLVKRGFLDAVCMPCNSWIAHSGSRGLGRILCELQPITRVVFTDRIHTSFNSNGGKSDRFGWGAYLDGRYQGPGSIPDCLFKYMNSKGKSRITYQTAELAYDALSYAAVDYGRILAGFEPIGQVAYAGEPLSADPHSAPSASQAIADLPD